MAAVEQIPSCAVDFEKHAAADDQGRATGHRLCGKHYKRLGEMLREIESEVGDLDPTPSIAMRWNTAGGSSSGGSPAFEQAPARLDHLVLTDWRNGKGYSEEPDDRKAAARLVPALLVLAAIADKVRAARSIDPPAVKFTDCVDRYPATPWHGPAYGLPCLHLTCRGITTERSYTPAPTIHSERDLLTRQLPWIAEWEQVGETFADLRRLLGQLRAANGTAEVPYGKCPIDKADAWCNGPLWPFKPKHTVGKWTGSSPDAIRCETCDSQWVGPGELARLVLMIEKRDKAVKALRAASA
jgi:hypothetical protein